MNSNTITQTESMPVPCKAEMDDDVKRKLKALRRAIRKQKRLEKWKQKKKDRPTNKHSSAVKLKLKCSKSPHTSNGKDLSTKLGSKWEDEEDGQSSVERTDMTSTNSNSKKATSKNGNDSSVKKSNKQISSENTKTPITADGNVLKKEPPQLIQNKATIYSQPVKFPINEECTSISVAPSSRHIIAGFTDGTLRLFDTTGRLWNQNKLAEKGTDAEHLQEEAEKELDTIFDCDSSDSENEDTFQSAPTKAKNRIVMSRTHQNYGAVACQIHAKGVITSLLMSVGCCEDGSFAFGGVLRGSTELVAVDLSLLEKYHNNYKIRDTNVLCILDLIKVYRYSDAKLKGFGACIRLKNTARPEYRLFTGKGIKNMHIWSFIPPTENNKLPIWQCLYDTPSNGNTITYLSFRTDSNGLLQAISKSDDQKLRVWDLSYEESQGEVSKSQKKSVIKQLAKKAENEKYPGTERPKRPPYIDVAGTENALGVYGPYVFSGGESMFNKIGVMHLDVGDIQSPFNHTELPLPNPDGSIDTFVGRRSGRSGRQQRGDLKAVVNIAGLSSSVTDVILQLSDGSMAYYSNSKGKQSTIKMLSSEPDNNIQKICVSRCRKGDEISIFTKADYNPNLARGSISMKFLSTEKNVFHGFTEPKSLQTPKEPKEIMKKTEKSVGLPEEKQMPKKVRENDEGKKRKLPLTKTDVVISEKKLKRSQLTKESKKIPTAEKNTKGDEKKILHQTEQNKMPQTLVSPDPSIRKRNVVNDQYIHTVPKQVDSPADKIATIGEGSPLRASVPGVAVSPEAPTPKTLDFTSEKSPKPAGPMKKFLSAKPMKSKSKIKVKKNIAASNKTKKNDKTERMLPNEKYPKIEKDKIKGQGKSKPGSVSTKMGENGKVEGILPNEKYSKSEKNKIKCHGKSKPGSVELDAASALCDLLSSSLEKANEIKDIFLSEKSTRSKTPLTPSSKKLDLASFPTYRKSGTFTSIMKSSKPTNVAERHFAERRDMMMHHRATHERLRDSIFSTVQQQINSLELKNGKRSIETMKSLVNATLIEYEQMKDDLILKQQMEAGGLAARQSLDLVNARAPEVKVSFPFPYIFENARSVAFKFIQTQSQE